MLNIETKLASTSCPKPSRYRSMLSVDELDKRPSRDPDYEAKSRALVALSQAMAASPDKILHRLAETALELCGAHSAGLSLLEEADQRKRFYWRVIVGEWEHNLGGGTPRDFGPCGDVLDRDAPLICRRPEQDFPYWREVQPPLDEGLLIPFYVNGEAIGTIWVVAHADSRRFDREDLRLMMSLGTFAAAAYQTWMSNSIAQRLAAIVETSDDAIVGIAPDGRIMSWNRSADRLFGYTSEEAVGEPIATIITPERQEQETLVLEEILQGKRVEPFETIHRRKDGTEIDVSVSVSPVVDGHGRIIGASRIARDITERKRAEQQREFLMREVNHRGQNMLSLVQSIANATAGSENKAFLENFVDRLHALSANQKLLVSSEWKGVEIEKLIRSQLAHFKDLLDDRIRLNGPSLTLTPVASQTLGMAIHELATNAGKYGALSVPAGHVDVDWEVGRTGDASPRFTITWREARGPKVAAPERKGFGSSVLGGMTKMNLAAEIDLDFAPTGVRWRLECPLNSITEKREAPRASPAPEPALTSVAGPDGRGRVLLVEDDWLLANDAAKALQDAGHEVIGPVASVSEAMDLLDHANCNAAVLDVNLGRETSEPIAERLAAQGMPFVVMTGYDSHQLPITMRSVPQVSKPVRLNVLVDQVNRLIMMRTRPMADTALH